MVAAMGFDKVDKCLYRVLAFKLDDFAVDNEKEGGERADAKAKGEKTIN